MKLTEHLTLIKTAANSAELEKRMRAAHEEFPGYPRTFYRIKDAMRIAENSFALCTRGEMWFRALKRAPGA